jgi:hypothetical protein
MAARTLSTTWKQYEKLADRFFTKKTEKAAQAQINELSQRTNESKIVDALASLLVTSHLGLETVRVRFAISPAKKPLDWKTNYDPEEKVILVNPVGVFQFCRDCEAALQTLKSSKSRENFQRYRYQSFLSELGKLPSRLLLLLLILERVAACKEVSKSDKRSTSGEAPDNEEYLNLLWAFKELESFYAETTGISLRSEFNVLWYESEWVNGK